MKNKELICGLDATEIEALKEKHGFLIVSTITQGDEKYHIIFKEPSFKTLEAIGNIGKNNDIKATQALYNNCMIKADDAVENRDVLKMKAAQAIGEHMESFKESVKNL